MARLDDLHEVSAWFSHRLAAIETDVTGVDVTAVRRASRGVSRETWLVDAIVTTSTGVHPEGFVVRRDHEAGTVDPVSLRTEYEIYRRLALTHVPVAIALWFEDDPAWAPDGRPAYVRTLIEGHWRLPFLESSDPADDDMRIEACKEHLDKLALVHTADWRAARFDEVFTVPDGPADCAHNLIRAFTSRLDEFQFEPSPVLAEGLSWLRATAPAAPCITLCKGTNGHGEEVWRDGRIVAMSDWELAALAEPAYDLAQIQQMVPTIKRDGRVVWGWPEALQYYESQAGIPVTMERVEYYRRFYALPMFMFTHNAARQVVHNGNRQVRFAWTATEMLYKAELRFSTVGGFAPRVACPVIEPAVDDVLATLIDTFDRYIMPDVSDEYAASLCITFSQVLRSVRARVAHEGEALHEDNRELRALLSSVRDQVDAPVGARIDEALADGGVMAGDGYMTVKRLQVEAVALRAALVACIDAVPDPQHPVRRAARVYLQHQLERQQPWLVDAFTGPRR